MIEFWKEKMNPITLFKTETKFYSVYKKKAQQVYVSRRKPIEIVKEGVLLKNGKYIAFFEYGYNSKIRKVFIKRDCETIDEAEKAYLEFINTKSKHKGINFCTHRKSKNWYSLNRGVKKYFNTEEEALDWKNKTPN